MKKDLLLNNLIEDGDGINTDVDNFDKERLDKLRRTKPVPATTLPDDLAEAILPQTVASTTLYVKHCNTCGTHGCKLENREKGRSGIVQCKNCIGRDLATFPTRFCKYCGKNIPNGEVTKRSCCDACDQVPRSHRSPALPKGTPA